MAPRALLRVFAVVGVCSLVVSAFTCGSPPAAQTDGGSGGGTGMCSTTQCGSDCVDTTTDVHHCGGCATDCTALPNVDPSGVSCLGGACVVAGHCKPGFAHCSNDAADGCEADLGDPAHCGACGTACAEPTPTCSQDADGGAACTSGCSGATPDRCDLRCVDLQTDPGFCGTCATACPAPQNGSAACDAGACDIACDPGFHGCGGACTSDTSPLSCGSSCLPCDVPANAMGTCDAGACGFACLPSFSDCDSDPSNGCEANTQTDVASCGACGNTCTATNGTAYCDAGTCGVGACSAGFADCDNDPANGCEVNTTTAADHCGTCGTVCTAANGTGACDAGVCDVGTCSAGWGNCDSDPSNGCEVDTNTSNTHCGACGTPCAPANGTGACVGGACTVQACTSPFQDCDFDPANGCEANTQSSPGNCGACGAACTVANATAGCAAGACTVASCNPGFADCDSDPSNGCEVSTDTSPGNCGACGTVCTVANGTAGCTAGACTVASCTTGFADCDGTAANGCEVNTTTDPNACGGCGTVCSIANGAAGCAAGACTVASCNAGFADCDGDPSNGCEVDTNTSNGNCGVCGAVCTVANGTPACAAGACTVASCNAGYADCDNSAASGCEVNLGTSAGNCGGCGNACMAPNGTPACVGGLCAVATCNAGFADCNGSPADGCEVNTDTNPGSCGTCGNVCTIANGTAACTNGTCAVGTCNPGFADCDGNPANGCEANVGSDANNCGVCGNTCNLANATPACTGGTCTVAACNAGFANCNNQPADGCEVNTTNNPLNCGGCGTQCFAANGTAGCAASQCTVASCNTGFGNCNGLAADGCETDLSTSNSNCGTCGNDCATACTGNVAATVCSAGACQVTACTGAHYNVDGTCANGCECTTSGTSASCASPSSLGALNVGQTLTYTGNLVPAGQEAYLAVTFNGNTNYSYHPRIQLTAGTAEFAFDVLTSCAGGTTSCGTEGGTSLGKSDWETLYTSGDPTQPANFNPIPPVGTVIIHVYRRTGQPLTCNNYTLTISN